MNFLTLYVISVSGTDTDILKAYGVAIITFILGPVILLLLQWIKDAPGAAQKKQNLLRDAIKEEIEKEVKLIKNDLDDVQESVRTIHEDIRRLENVLIYRNQGRKISGHQNRIE